MVKAVHIILQIALLFVLYWVGVFIQQFFHLTIPGSVIGLILLFLLLISGLIKEHYIKAGAGFMNRHIVLFFIPATIGIVNYYGLFKGKGMLLVVIIMISTCMVMVISGGISQKMYQEGEKRHG